MRLVVKKQDVLTPVIHLKKNKGGGGIKKCWSYYYSAMFWWEVLNPCIFINVAEADVPPQNVFPHTAETTLFFFFLQIFFQKKAETTLSKELKVLTQSPNSLNPIKHVWG